MKNLKKQKQLLSAQIDEQINICKTEKRSLSSEEAEKVEEIKKELENINATIDLLMDSAEEVKEDTKEEGAKETMQTESRNYKEELRAITSATTHAEAIPEGLHGDIMRKIEEKSQVYADSKAVNYVGDLAVLVDGENAEASILDETEELTETDLGSVEKVVMKDKRVATLVTVSKHMLHNSPALTMDFIADKVASRVSNTIESQIFNADGGSKKMTSGLLAKGEKLQGNVTIENIMAMVSSLKAGYLKGAKFYCNRETFKALSGLLDGTKRPYLTADVINNAPAYTILGVPVEVTEALSGELVLANVGEAIMVKHGQEPTIELLQETFALKGSVGIMCESYMDCAVVNPEAVVVLAPVVKAVSK